MEQIVENDNAIIVDLQHRLQIVTEALEITSEENKRLRNRQRISRTVVNALRSQLGNAHQNDENFKAMCQEGAVEMSEFGSGFVAEVVPEAEGGLPDATGYSGTSGLER